MDPSTMIFIGFCTIVVPLIILMLVIAEWYVNKE
nr:MAG TPA: hypothetical protein [Crassvirales sp.]